MYRQVIFWLIAFIVIVLVIMWVIGGGPRRAYEEVTSFEFLPFSPETATGFRLPWQPAELFPVIDISTALQPASDDLSGAQYELADLEAEYERLNREAAMMRFGSPSPYTGTVSIVDDVLGVRATEPTEEYLQIAVDYTATSPIDVSGWSIESALSGTKAYLPGVASPFLMGTTNVSGSAQLPPGGLAIVTTASSPVGASFRENICTGYLDQYQRFAPQLGNECPSPASVLPLTEENLRAYGDTCFDAVAALYSCQFPQSLPDTVTPACRAYLTDALSYNGCVQRNRTRQSFETNRWRFFLGGQREIWRNSHDAIRLLDAQGKTVDVFVY